jgi:hypothetical protein
MFVERGLSLRLPKSLSNPAAKSIYTRIFSSWITESLKLLESHSPAVARSLVRLMDYGRIESIPSRKRVNGVVIGAPHGTFDEHTAELVNRLSYRTGLAAVIASGFTPTECAGWRINVNRPTERLYPSDGFEIQSDRAKNVYYNFKEAVLEASRDDLKLYVDIHQNGRQAKIEVATVGITKQEAQFIKRTYRQLRDRVLASNLGVTSVDLLIEPLDEIEIGAWNAKAQGMLSVATRSLHFELPLYSTLGSTKARQAYTDILTLLFEQTIAALINSKSPRGGERP